MAYKPQAGPQMAAPNVIPMADIMLVLLIIFMVVTPMLQKGQSVDMVRTDNPRDMQDADKDDAIIVAITRDGKLYLGNTQMPKEDLTGQIKDRISTRLDKTVYVRAMLARSTAKSSPSSMRFALPASLSSGCPPRKTRRMVLLLRLPRIEDRSTCLHRSFADLLKRRAGSHPARFHGLRRRSASGPQETRYGDGCRKGIRRSDGDAQRRPAHRHFVGADHYFHGHHPAYAEGPGHARPSAFAEPATKRRA